MPVTPDPSTPQLNADDSQKREPEIPLNQHLPKSLVEVLHDCFVKDGELPLQRGDNS